VATVGSTVIKRRKVNAMRGALAGVVQLAAADEEPEPQKRQIDLRDEARVRDALSLTEGRQRRDVLDVGQPIRDVTMGPDVDAEEADDGLEGDDAELSGAGHY
jgi:hypothetical protein